MTERARFRERGGVTLIEMIVVLAILAIVGTVTIHYLVSATQMYVQVQAQREADGDSFETVRRMRREMRTLETVVSADVNGVSFVNRSGATNAFRLSGKAVTLNGAILASNVGTYRLAYYDATNRLLAPLPLDATNRGLVRRLALEIVTSNAYAADVLHANFYRTDGIQR